MEIRKERVTSKLFNLFARCPETTSALKLDDLPPLEDRIKTARSNLQLAQNDLSYARAKVSQREKQVRLAQARLNGLLAEAEDQR